MLSDLAAAIDPCALLHRAGLTELDDWQSDVLRSTDPRILMLATRQGGKSTVAGGKAITKAQTKPKSLSLLLSPSERQSAELFRKTLSIWHNAGRAVPAKSQSALQLELVNGSRILALPGTEHSIRGYSNVDLLVIDEAARVADELYYSIRPMVSVSQGEICALTTPFGKRGWFHHEWSSSDYWKKLKITARECPRLTEEILEQERQSLGEYFFRQEYLCEFLDTSGVESFIDPERIERCISDEIERHEKKPIDLGLDVARSLKGDKSALVVAQDNAVLEIETAQYDDLMQLCGMAVGYINKYSPRSIRVDDGGVGGGVVDRLLEMQSGGLRKTPLWETEIVDFQFGSKAWEPERFCDVRTEMWFHAADLVHTGKLKMPRNERLMQELAGPSMGQDSRSRLKLESKDAMRRRGLRSPDIADALCLAVYPDDWLGGSGGW